MFEFIEDARAVPGLMTVVEALLLVGQSVQPSRYGRDSSRFADALLVNFPALGSHKFEYLPDY